MENLLLPSLHGQTEQDWRLILLTSALMPPEMLDRLRDMTADPRIHVEVSEADDVNSAILPTVKKLRLNKSAQFRIHDNEFRIHDNDCLGKTYMSRLRDVAQAMEFIGSFTYSIAVGLVTTAYVGQAPQAYRMNQPFHSVGTAVRMPEHQRGRMSVFSFGHFNLQRRWMSVLDTGVRGRKGLGYLSTRVQGHDSTPDTPEALGPPTADPIDWDAFDAALAEDFPFLDGAMLRQQVLGMG